MKRKSHQFVSMSEFQLNANDVRYNQIIHRSRVVNRHEHFDVKKIFL